MISADQGERQYLKDIWRYRELFYFLAWRDILVRYKQTVIGVTWSLLRPLLTMIVFSLVFGKLAKLPAHGIPYPIIVLTGLLPWQFFANALSESSNSLVGNANLISKVYFPRLIIPTSAVIVSIADFLIAFALLLALLAWYGFWPGWTVFALPLFASLAAAAALGTGLLFAALLVKYRDFRFVIPFVIQVGLYASPVGYLSSLVPERWRLLFSLNPMVGIIDGFRWSLLGGRLPIDWVGVAVSASVVGLLFLAGFLYFRKTERTFADVI